MPSVKERAAAIEAGKLTSELTKLKETIAIFIVADLIALADEYKGNSKGFYKEVGQWQARLEVIRTGLFACYLTDKKPTYKDKMELFINDRQLPDMKQVMDIDVIATTRALDTAIGEFATATSWSDYANGILERVSPDPRLRGLNAAVAYLREPSTTMASLVNQ